MTAAAAAADTAEGEVSLHTFHRGLLLASGSASESSSPPVCPASSSSSSSAQPDLRVDSFSSWNAAEYR